ncbi:hypothetical protein H2199_001133 [Coniosporium tulheliwenetii]|uniref:Uncharacterized protein n=1 Tax=Coniosporium tulheliwenetii TaxID=3383036 RepID=A0ACC2ZLB4_9PEZI|nr:hypothetical protein H2199_001133 [Cladosporium sp. JES 115]
MAESEIQQAVVAPPLAHLAYPQASAGLLGDMVIEVDPEYARKPDEVEVVPSTSSSADEGVDEMQNFDDYPSGYPQLAAVVNSDPNFRVYRRFGTLRNRVMFYRQHELAKLEERLQEMDLADDQAHPYRNQSIRRDKADPESERQALMDEIDQKLEHYDKLLAREQKSLLMERPTKRNYRSLINYIWNEKPIVQSEMTFLNPADDFVILSKEQDSPFHVRIEKLLQKSGRDWLKRLFSTPEQRQKTQDSAIDLYSKARINYLVQAIVALVTIILLMTPICLLFYLDFNREVKVVVVLLFVSLFPATITILARPKNHEVFAATAA